MDAPRSRVALVAAAKLYLGALRQVLRDPRARDPVGLGPLVVAGHRVALRPPRLSDAPLWREIRLRDRQMIESFWVTSPLSWTERHTDVCWVRECLEMRRASRAGRALPLVIEIDGQFAGQCNLERIDMYSRTAEMGIWLDSHASGRGVATAAGALLLDHAFGALALKRVTAPIRMDNVATARGAERLGFRHEGTMSGFLDVGGRVKDHELWAITSKHAPTGGFARALATQHVVAIPARGRRVGPARRERASFRLPRSKAVLVAVGRYYLRPFRRIHLRHALSRQRGAYSRLRLGPSAVSGAQVVLRPPRLSDAAAWREIRLRDRALIEPFWVTSTQSWAHRHTETIWVRECLLMRRAARAGHALPLVIEIDGQFAGQCNLERIDAHSCTAEMGIWLDSKVAHRGVGAAATTLLLEHAFGALRIHRITAPVGKGNVRAAHLMQRVGMKYEATMVSFLDVGGQRSDHDLWAVMSEHYALQPSASPDNRKPRVSTSPGRDLIGGRSEAVT
ncbi:GNAT family N-acetyltransferase [Rhodococcus wratislaviensis]|uniref:Putative acetyltransferase n=1 Tax=Rhodococcus wratislaviensis NBRC 100605 TaxID=1219028 RepID=X0QIM3_RHOWR|nr:GNAT family protein [Rhodococcus wratislaviensis]GAF50716.1 putative acetyltransferase [Rhodococcus wratislaviensis NBRC 100605]